MRIEKNSVVSLRYTMKDKGGEIIDDIMQSLPVDYLHGCGNIIPSLERNIEGLAQGEKKSFDVHDEVLNKPLHFDVVIDKIRAATTDEIEKKRVINDCGPDCCC
ncbi:MAG TPA: hypothetical protein VMT76_13895 [Puia sp.]|nr:hypothetical protein [Puia sp.]